MGLQIIFRNMETFCLKWNEFEANIRESFKTLRDEERLFDVTLATDDGQHIQAHKMVLSAGSHFFSDIFIKTNNYSMLIYLKGISSAELKPVIDFLYNGEAFITQEYLTTFIGTAKELQIKGLLGDLQGIGENQTENKKSIQHYTENDKVMTKTEGFMEEDADLLDKDDVILVETDNSKPVLNPNRELDLQIETIIEKSDGLWRCKVCDKRAYLKHHIKSHAESHIEGVSHACHICSKSFSSRHNLQSHISKQHSELFSCDVCEKTGMTRGAYG